MRWRLTRRAERDVVAIYREGLRTWGMAQADAYHDRLEEVFGLLARFPRLAPERREIEPPVQVHPHGAHIVVHVVEPDGGVLIVRVRHGREDWIGDPAGDVEDNRSHTAPTPREEPSMSRATCPLKLPRPVKEEAARLAREDGVSLNHWIVAAVAQKVGAAETAAEFFARRAEGHDLAALGDVLTRVPDRAPKPGDERSDAQQD